MLSPKDFPSPASFFSAYASVAASAMLFRSMARDFLPRPVRSYLLTKLRAVFDAWGTSCLTLVINESTEMTSNQIYQASETYLSTKVGPNTKSLRISKSPKDKTLKIQLEKGEKVVDVYEGVELRWKFRCEESRKDEIDAPNTRRFEQRCFELTFESTYKDFVLSSYLPYVLERAQRIQDENRVIKMFTLRGGQPLGGAIKWTSVNLEHPSTFKTVAMDPDMKNALIEDLDRFVERKEFYRRVGRAWKRGYLLYGPPGTGKSSLVAAIANHLKFDVYDLQLSNLMTDSDLRRLFLSTGNRSILVIEDIDCTAIDFPDRRSEGRDEPKKPNIQLTLSGLLNFIDGLWSSCGDERIIIFTTNHKDKLDPALLRPGRMDMHIHMSYCTFHAFKELASNYLNLLPGKHHQLYGEIEGLIKDATVTPAQIAEEMMTSEDSDVALQGVVKLLKRKRFEEEDEKENEGVVENTSEGKKRRNLCARPKASRVTVARRRK